MQTQHTTDIKPGGNYSATVSNGSGVSVELAYSTSDFLTRFEEITPNSDGNRHTWKNFEHYKCSNQSNASGVGLEVAGMQQFPADPPVWSTVGSVQFAIPARHLGPLLRRTGAGGFVWCWGEPGRPNQGLPGMYEKRQDGGFVPPPAGLNDMVATSLKTMLPSIKSDLSLVNSIIELKDFKSILSGLRNVHNRWKSYMLQNSVYDVPTRVSKLAAEELLNKGVPLKTTAKNTLGRTAGGYLQWKFAIAPLLSDIAAIQAAIAQYQRRLSDMVTRAGRVQRRHFAFKWRELTEYSTERDNTQWFPVYDPSGHFEPGSRYVSIREVFGEPSEFHAEIEYSYNFTRYQAANAQLLSLLDALGVNLNPAIIWNAIPWTFVLDWFIGVGRWLDQFKVTNMDPQINIVNYLWSVKRKRRVVCSHVCENWRGVQRDRFRVAMPTFIEEAYRRHVEMPGINSITSSGLNSQEFTLGASLVIARKWQPRSRGGRFSYHKPRITGV